MVDPIIVNAGRNDMAREYFHGTGVEVGVERGVFSKTIARNAHPKKLYCVDPWLAYRGYREHVSQDKLDAFFEETKTRLAPYPCQIIRKKSIDAAKDFEDHSLDFVYIDANHSYENVRDDIAAWYPKLKPGGFLTGHDYTSRKGQAHIYGVKQAVHEFIENEKIQTWWLFKGDRTPSWMLEKHAV